MSFVSDIVGGILGAGAADEAAGVESKAATQAQNLIDTKAQNSLDFESSIWKQDQKRYAPYQTLGSTSANHLAQLLKQGFQAPTLTEAEQTPGFQFRLQQGSDAIAKEAAATGNLQSGNTGVALENYGQGLAESAYGDDYNRALQTYMANYTSLLGGTTIGENSTAELGQFGQAAGQTEAGVNMNAAEGEARQINNAAAARASGYLGTAKAWSGMAGGLAADATSFIGGMPGVPDWMSAAAGV